MALENELKQCEEMFAFLQGTVPDGYHIPPEGVPKLTPGQAWTVIWYVQELHTELNDEIERCDECGVLYDSAREGMHRDEKPFHLCGGCESHWLDDED